MTPPTLWRSLRPLLLAGAAYVVIGVATAAFAAGAASHRVVVAWRLAAWGLSAALFLEHIGFEHARLRTRPRTTAWRAALAAALGAFGLAAAANVHALHTGSGSRALLHLALAIWPAATFVPAFLVAWVVAASLMRWTPHRE